MRILITGSTGLLGQALIRQLALRAEVVGLSRHAPATPCGYRHVVCDLTNERHTQQVVQAAEPDLVVHTQALSDVDQCERQPQLARAMNVQATAHLARGLEASAALLVCCSTDYVFDGTKGQPYDERDTPRPLSVYGRSKLEGEHVALVRPRAVVVRTSTLFGAGRHNFCDHIVERLRAHQPVEAFIDQVTSPTYTEDLAEGLSELAMALLSKDLTATPRVFHLTNAGDCSRAVFAEQVADRLGCCRDLIRRIPRDAQRRPAPRPAYSALTSVHIPQLIGRTLRPWNDALDAYLRQRRWLN